MKPTPVVSLNPTPVVLANIAAEEGAAGSGEVLREPRVRTLARLFQALFSEPPAFEWLALAPGSAAAWLNTSEAALEAEAQGCRLQGAAPEVVARVHDKAFCHRVAQRESLLPRILRDAFHVFEPGHLTDAEATLARIEEVAAGWPPFIGGRFTLKPRLGTSARGRVAGRVGEDYAAAVRGALPRLAQCGGAVLEPWLERCGDYSSQLHVGEPEGTITLLGTLEQVTAASGVVAGHRGTVDSRGRVTSGSPWDEEVREVALSVALAARDEGFSGPCGVDAFAFDTPEGSRLRGALELNARFTLGTVVLAAVRKALPTLKTRLGLGPGERMHFYFGLDAPASGWPEPDAATRCLFSHQESGDPLHPALWVERDPEVLSRALDAS